MQRSSRENPHLLLVSVIAATLLMFPGRAPAEEQRAGLGQLSMDELLNLKVTTVYGASKHVQESSEAPSSVTIVTSEDIKKHGYRTLSDILRGVRSFFTTYDRSYSYLGVRGFGLPGDYSSRVLILIDGHRTNENVYLAGAVGTDFLLDVDLVDRVEIIRGPGSSLYGTNAYFGVINIITRRGRELQGPEASVEAGSLETFKGRLTYGRQWQSGPELLLSATAYDSEGDAHLFFKEFDDPATSNGIADDKDRDRSYQYFSTVSFRDFALRGGYIHRKKDAPTGAFETVFDSEQNWDIDERGYVEAVYEHGFHGDLNVTGRLSYDYYWYKWSGSFDVSEDGGAPDLVTNHDLAKGAWWSGELKLTKKIGAKHFLTSGMEYQWNTIQDLANYDEEPRTVYSDIQKHTNNWAVYLQDEVSFTAQWLANAGLRYDHYDTFGGTTNPRVALIYRPITATALKFLYGRAFRAPNIFELYFESEPSNQLSNPDLKPESIETYEVVVEQELGKHWRGTLAGFFNKLEDLIVLESDPDTGADSYQNIGAYRVTGAEVEIAGTWPGGLEVGFSYTFEEAENEDTGEGMANSPRHLVKGKAVVPLFAGKLFAGADFLFTSARKTVDGAEVGSYGLVNATLFSLSALPGLELSFNIYNIFDVLYADPVSPEQVLDTIEQDGRTFRVKATYRF